MSRLSTCGKGFYYKSRTFEKHFHIIFPILQLDDNSRMKSTWKRFISSMCCSVFEVHHFIRCKMPNTTNIRYFKKAPEDFLTEFMIWTCWSMHLLNKTLFKFDDFDDIHAWNRSRFWKMSRCRSCRGRKTKSVLMLYKLAGRTSDTDESFGNGRIPWGGESYLWTGAHLVAQYVLKTWTLQENESTILRIKDNVKTLIFYWVLTYCVNE